MSYLERVRFETLEKARIEFRYNTHNLRLLLNYEHSRVSCSVTNNRNVYYFKLRVSSWERVTAVGRITDKNNAVLVDLVLLRR